MVGLGFRWRGNGQDIGIKEIHRSFEKLLTQRIYRIGAHCQFSQPEMIKAFDDLVAWVRTGTKPQGDEVEGDLSNAGMTFTNPLRQNDPGGRSVTTGSPR